MGFPGYVHTVGLLRCVIMSLGVPLGSCALDTWFVCVVYIHVGTLAMERFADDTLPRITPRTKALSHWLLMAVSARQPQREKNT